MRLFYFIVMSMLALSLSACTMFNREFPSHAKDYKTYGTSIKPIRMPAGLTSSKISTFFPIPPGSGKTTPGPISLIPPGSNIAQYQKR